MDSLEQLRTFLHVAERGSFTRAADSLGLPKASVSLAVQRLETAMGTQLLHRTTRRVQLTADGEQLFQRARDLLDDVEELQGMFRRDIAQLRGRLRVDMSSGLARFLVMPRLPDFLQRHPGLEIEISGTDRRVDLVREGFDCVLRVGALDDNTLVARPLGSMPVVNCASPAYLAAHGTPHALEDLHAHRLVHYVSTLGQRSSGFEYFDGEQYRTLPMSGAVTVNSGDGYNAAALAGLGIIQVPQLGVRQALQEGLLVEVLPQLPAEPMPVTLLYAQRRHLPARVRVFMDWVAALLQPYLIVR
ncbi:LysR family transcriptional regulator [Stenotrophomonas tumulicola]|uniref:LysR family transcriptional regulator n=1 Tax=Stenotrophomonas tumulicola TaxID=1685415 RepID=A0A7W3FKT4_9GAMM|nr:LysR family transcriptional regulator [Stenotrophomonas tumulicola]MBA8681359.1 LysR family transcriptional regulator [Stenotrophomonas tumulicola]